MAEQIIPDDVVEEVAKELIKIPRGYVGITDPVSPEIREAKLKKARAQAKAIIPIIQAWAERENGAPSGKSGE